MWIRLWVCEWLMVQRGSLRSTSAPVVQVLVSCEGQSSCTALILTGKRCEHNCSASAEQPTRCQKCRVTPRAATWPRNALSHWTTLFSPFFFPLADCSQLALREWKVRYSVKWVMTSLSKEPASLCKVSWSFDEHLSNLLLVFDETQATLHVQTFVKNLLVQLNRE